MHYERPQWTGRVGPGGHVECPSCLGYHDASYVGCNGWREPAEDRCTSTIGEVRCDRPAGHLGAHEALSDGLRLEWEITRVAAR